MLALTEQHVIALVSAALSGATLVVVALIGRGGRERGAEASARGTKAAEDRAELKEAVQPTNGHATLGDGLAAVEDRLIENRIVIDSLEAKLDGHIADTAPLMARAIKDWGADGTKEG